MPRGGQSYAERREQGSSQNEAEGSEATEEEATRERTTRVGRREVARRLQRESERD